MRVHVRMNAQASNAGNGTFTRKWTDHTASVLQSDMFTSSYLSLLTKGKRLVNETLGIRFVTVCFDQLKSSLAPWEIRKEFQRKSKVLQNFTLHFSEWYCSIGLFLCPWYQAPQFRSGTLFSLTVEDVHPAVITIVKSCILHRQKTVQTLSPKIKNSMSFFLSIMYFSHIKRECSSGLDCTAFKFWTENYTSDGLTVVLNGDVLFFSFAPGLPYNTVSLEILVI